jgi:hypothetical protein
MVLTCVYSSSKEEMNLYEYANKVGAFSDRILGTIALQLFIQLGVLHTHRIYLGMINPSMIVVTVKNGVPVVYISNIVP